MGYVHCCSALWKSKTYVIAPGENFVMCTVEYLEKCPICGHTIVQLTRLDKQNNISIVRKKNKKAVNFLNKIQNSILYEQESFSAPSPKNYKRSYLEFSEFGKRKRCYSNLSTLKIGLNKNENKNLHLNRSYLTSNSV